jgi:putative hydrolase of HD superfamily
MESIESLLEFMMEVEKLKDVYRKTKPVGLDRLENSAEHSWHVCLMALMFKDYANDSIDINRVIKMLLIHDLGEIDAGDVIIYDSETPELKAKEAEGVKRLLNYLSEKDAKVYLDLWYEFEAGESIDAKYAKAIDRIPPLFHNLYGEGNTWKTYDISFEKVLNLNKRIKAGSEDLWKVIEKKLYEGQGAGKFSSE